MKFFWWRRKDSLNTELDGLGQGEDWERRTLQKLALDALSEQKRARNWGILFKSLTFIYVAVVLGMTVDWTSYRDATVGSRHTALVDLVGVIEARGDASGDKLITALQSAFKDTNTQGVILRINSPGGSPVQSGLIYDEIRRLRTQYPDTPLHVVVEDICASGGYYVAAAADNIYVDKASIVGSIGVVMSGWGATGLMEKLGIERRVLTAGENKAFLDPFLPQDDKQRAHALGMLREIHQQFIDMVKQGRGERLKETPEMFSGLVWSGARSVELGLADGLGSVESVARDVIKAPDIIDFTEKQNVAERLARRFGAGVGTSLGQLMGNALSGVGLR